MFLKCANNDKESDDYEYKYRKENNTFTYEKNNTYINVVQLAIAKKCNILTLILSIRI